MAVPVPNQAVPAPSKTMHGARALLYINGQPTGIFSQVSWGVSYDASPVYILGRYSPAEIALTSQEPVSITMTGWRVVSSNLNDYAGPYSNIGGSMSKLQNLLTDAEITVQLLDRQTNEVIMFVQSVRTTGFSTSVNARGLEEITVNAIGISASDESDVGNGSGTPQSEAPGSADLPPV